MTLKEITVRDEKIKITKFNYENNNRVCLIAMTEDGELYSDVSTNLPDAQAEDGEFYVKAGCVEEEIATALEELGIVSRIASNAKRSGFNQYHKYIIS